MDEIGSRASVDGSRAPAGGSSALTSAPRRTSFHVHATPTAAVAEMDLRRRQWMEWLVRSRRRTGAGDTGDRSEGSLSG